MDEITVIHTDKAPAALGPYSQALAWNGLLVLSGQTGLDPVTGELVSDFAGQVRQVLDNLGAVLSQAGAGFADVLAADVFLTDMGRFAEFNAIYAEYFPGAQTGPDHGGGQRPAKKRAGRDQIPGPAAPILIRAAA